MQFSKYQNAKSLLGLSGNWKLMKFDEILKDVTRTGTKIPSGEYEDDGVYPIIDQGKNFIAGYSNLDNPINGEKIIFGDHTRVLKFIDFDKFHIGADGVKVLENKIPNIAITKYIYYYLSSIKIPNTGYNRHFKYLKDIVIPIPDIEIQKKVLDLFDKLGELIKKRHSQITALNELTQSLFLEIFGDPRLNPRAWDTKNLTQIVVKDKRAIKRGPFGGALKKDIFVDSGYLVYEQYHAINDDFTVNRYFITEEKYKELEAFKVMPGDLIVSCSGVTLGRIAELPADALEGIINQALLKITLDINVMNKEFFKFVFRSEHIQSLLFSVSRGSGVPNLPSMSVIKQIEFLCPPIEMQNEFAKKSLDIDTEIKHMKKSLNEMELLYSSLLLQAFEGKLFQN